MTPEEKYKMLPIGTKLITPAGFQWIKITRNTWRCVSTIPQGSWKVDDIYTDFGDESITEGKYILPFDLYLKQAEQL